MKNNLLANTLLIALVVLIGGGFLTTTQASEPSPVQLNAVAPVCGDGVFIPQLFTSTQPLPAIRVCDAPTFGKNITLSREQLAQLLASNAPSMSTNFSGESVKISRRSRTLGESDILGLLTAALQSDYIKDRGQLELRLAQPWVAVIMPDETLTLDILELPSLGVTPGFIVRFALRTQHENLGTWTANIKARVWREVWVASQQIKRGADVKSEALARERRDVLTLRETPADFDATDEALEFAEPIPAGVPVLARMIKAKAVVHRGQRIDALVQDGGLSVKTKVEALEDGAPGEFVHARNSVTRREVSGKVLNERTILISL
jgi:flagella basal body P-ring formation protein FlgA